MLRCKCCGNQVDESVYVAQNGMCDICLHTSMGGDDPILPPPSVDVKNQSSGNEVRQNDAVFDPERFVGKLISDYQFPSFITSELISSGEGFSSAQTLLLSETQDRGGCMRVFLVIMILFFSPFLLVGFGIICMLIYGVFIGHVGGITDSTEGAVACAVFAVIWNVMVYAMFIGIIRHFISTIWINLKDDCLECYYGKVFKPEKAKKIPLQRLDVSYEVRHSSKGGTFYEMVLAPSIGKKFKFSVRGEIEAKYWQDFLRWYCREKTGMSSSHNLDW